MFMTHASSEAAVPSGDPVTNPVEAIQQSQRDKDSVDWKAGFEIVQADFDRLQIEYDEEVARHDVLREDHVRPCISLSVHDSDAYRTNYGRTFATSTRDAVKVKVYSKIPWKPSTVLGPASMTPTGVKSTDSLPATIVLKP